MTLSDPSICGIFGSSLSKLSFICGICGSSPRRLLLLPFLPIAFMEFIGRDKTRAYLQCIYCKVKQRIQRELSHIIKSRCACVWNVWWIYMVANLILLCSLTHISLLKLGNILQENRGYLYSSFFFCSLFFRRASKYPLF